MNERRRLASWTVLPHDDSKVVAAYEDSKVVAAYEDGFVTVPMTFPALRI